MPATLELQSTLTDRYQTTVPETVRRTLGLGKRDKLLYSVRPDGEVVLSRAKPEDGIDPVLSSFLQFLADDMAKHPEQLKTLDTAFVQGLRSLTAGVALDLDTALQPEDE